MVGKLCSARNCNNKTFKEKNFFRFPVDTASATIWVINSNREELLSNLNTLYTKHWLCEDHFEERMFMNRKHNRLKPNAYPTLFNLSNECMCGKQNKAVASDHSYAALRELPGESKKSEAIITHKGQSGTEISSRDVLADLIKEFDISQTLTENGSDAVSQNETNILGIQTVDEFLANFISNTEIKAPGNSAAECEKAKYGLHMDYELKKSSKFVKETPVTTEEDKSTQPSNGEKKLHDKPTNLKCQAEEILENPIEYEYFDVPMSEKENESSEDTQSETNSADKNYDFSESSEFETEMLSIQNVDKEKEPVEPIKSEKEVGKSHTKFEYETEFKKFLEGIPRNEELAASKFEKIAPAKVQKKILILSDQKVADHNLCNTFNFVNSSKKGSASSEICSVRIPDKLPDTSVDQNNISLDESTSSSTLSASKSCEYNPVVDSMQTTYSKPEKNISSVDQKINLNIVSTRETLPGKNIASACYEKDFCENVKKNVLQLLSLQEKESSKIVKNQTTPKMEDSVSVKHQNKRNLSLTSSEEKSPPSKRIRTYECVNSTSNSKPNSQNSDPVGNETIPSVNSKSISPSDRILRSKQRTVSVEVQVDHKSNSPSAAVKLNAPPGRKKCVANDHSAKLPVTPNGSSKGQNSIGDASRSNLNMATDHHNAPSRGRNYIAVYHGDKLLVTPDDVPSNGYNSDGTRSNLLVTANPLQTPIAGQSYVAVCHGDKVLVTPDQVTVGHGSNLLVTGVQQNIKSEVGQMNKSQISGNQLNVSTIEPNYVLVGDSLLVNTAQVTAVPQVQKLVPVVGGSSFVESEKLSTVPGGQNVVTARQNNNLLAASGQIMLPTGVHNLMINPEQSNGTPTLFTFRQGGKTFLVVPEIVVPSLSQSLNSSHTQMSQTNSEKSIVGNKVYSSRRKQLLSDTVGVEDTSLNVNSAGQNGNSVGAVNSTPTTSKLKNSAPEVRNSDSSPDKRRSLTKEIHVAISTQTNQYLSANSPRKQKLRQTIKDLNKENRLLKKKLVQLEARLSGKR